MNYNYMLNRSAVALFLCCMATAAQAQLNISFDFTNFMMGPAAPTTVDDVLKNDNWPAGWGDTEKLNAAKDVMIHAGDILMGAFSNCTDVTVNQSIDVGWGIPASSNTNNNVLATGGAGWSGSSPFPFTSGFLSWDQSQTSGAVPLNTFFVDLTPADNVEFGSFGGPDTRTLNLSGTQINAEDRHYSSFNGSDDSATNSDMLTTSLHEIMHTLGVLSSYPNYSVLDIGNDGDLDLMAAGATYEAIYSGGHTIETLPWAGPGGPMALPTYYPNLIGPSTVTGTRSLLTDLDTLLLANINGFGEGTGNEFACVDQPHDTIPVPEPNGMALMVFGILALVARRR